MITCYLRYVIDLSFAKTSSHSMDDDGRRSRDRPRNV